MLDERTLHKLREIIGYTAPELLESKLAAFIEELIEDEREACAKIAETVITGTSNIDVLWSQGAEKAAAAIRNRK